MSTIPQQILDRTVFYKTREEWLASRPSFLGASEIAAVLGRSEYKDATPFAVWRAKVQPEAEPEEDPQKARSFEWGHRHERTILEKYQDEHPDLLILPTPRMVVAHPVYGDVIRGTPDALAFDRESGDLVRGVDAKSMSPFFRHAFGEPGTDQIPDAALIQGLVYCEILELPAWDFPVLFGRDDYNEYPVERDAALAERLLVPAMEWWHTYVVTKTMPPVDGSKAAERLLRERYPEPRLPMLEPTPRIEALVKRARAARAAEKASKEERAEADNLLRALCADHEGVTGLFSYRKNKASERTDWKAAAQEFFKLNPVEGARVLAKHTAIKPGPRVLRLNKER